MVEDFVEFWVVEYTTMRDKDKFVYSEFDEVSDDNEYRFRNEMSDQVLILQKENLCEMLIRPLNTNYN